MTMAGRLSWGEGEVGEGEVGEAEVSRIKRIMMRVANLALSNSTFCSLT